MGENADDALWALLAFAYDAEVEVAVAQRGQRAELMRTATLNALYSANAISASGSSSGGSSGGSSNVTATPSASPQHPSSS